MNDNDRLLLGLPLRTAVWYSLMILAACASYSILWREAPVQQGDSSQYLEVARDLADGRIDVLHDRTPGYPLLLVVTGSTVQPTRALFFASLLLHFASIWLLATVLHSAGVRRGWLLTFAAVLLLPPYVEPAAYVMSENLAQFTLVVGFACLVLWFSHRTAVWLVASAVAFGYSAVTRPANQALTPIICLSLLVMPLAIPRTHIRYGDAARAGTALLAGTLLILGAVSMTNYVRFDYFGLSPMSGFHLSTKTMPFVERLPDRYATVREILIRERDSELTKRGGLHTGSQAVWGVRSQLQAATGLSQPQLSAYLFKMNIELIGRAPVEYLQEVMRSMSGYWFPAAGPLADMSSTMLRWSWALLHFALLCLLFLQLLAFGGMATFDASRRVFGARVQGMTDVIAADAPQTLAYLLSGVIVFYTMLLTCAIDIGEVRQRRSTDVFFVFMCFLGAYVWRQTINRSQGIVTAATVGHKLDASSSS